MPTKTAPKPWVFLFGPTAVGKTKAVEALIDAGLAFQVISADAFQIYRGCNIGTAKPDSVTLAKIPHHCIDIRNPDQTYSVVEFVNDAYSAANTIHAAGQIPLVSGGTAYYYRHLLAGIPDAPPADPAIRLALDNELAIKGSQALYAELLSLDPKRAQELHPNDAYRIQRALEIIRITGQPQSSFKTLGKAGLLNDPAAQVIIIGLHRPRLELRKRIAERVDQMFDAGLESEIAQYRQWGFDANTPAMRAIGYSEFFERQTIPDIRQGIIDHSCQYAKRQMTFFRSFKQVQWLPADDHMAIIACIHKCLENPAP